MNDLADLPSSPVLDLLREIDRQQDDVLNGLDELNRRLEAILKSCAPPKEEPETIAFPAAADEKPRILRAA